jgi:DNA-binding response OmpR family regulator
MRVLIVEDEAVIASLIESTLAEAGYSVVGPVATVEQALESVKGRRCDAAVLDVRVNGREIYSVADALGDCGIPFVFVSGFAQEDMPPKYRSHPYVAKPFHPATILARLIKIMPRAADRVLGEAC